MSAKFGQDDPVKLLVKVNPYTFATEKMWANVVPTDPLAPIKRKFQQQHSQMLNEIANSASGIANAEYLQEFGQQMSEMSGAARAAKNLESLFKPKSLEFPVLKIDFSKILNPLESASKRLSAEHKLLEEKSRESLIDSFKRLNYPPYCEETDVLPPNWGGLEVDDFAILETLLLDEGLALAWVPDTALLQKLLEAKTQQERRDVLDKDWESVAHSCQSLLEGISSTKYDEHLEFATEIVETLLSGHAPASQALAANLLDTLLCYEFTYKGKGKKMRRDKRPSTNSLQAKKNMVYGGIWGCFQKYQIDEGDPIPLEFSRHASAHGVSHRQYTRPNALIALMHVTAYLCWLDIKDRECVYNSNVIEAGVVPEN